LLHEIYASIFKQAGSGIECLFTDVSCLIMLPDGIQNSLALPSADYPVESNSMLIGGGMADGLAMKEGLTMPEHRRGQSSREGFMRRIVPGGAQVWHIGSMGKGDPLMPAKHPARHLRKIALGRPK